MAKFGVYVNKSKAVECGYLSANGVSPWRSDAVPFESREAAEAKIASMDLRNTSGVILETVTAYVCEVY